MLLFLQPLQAQENPIYTSSDGYITVGTWFLYNATVYQENKTFLINVTVVEMNATHVKCLYHNLNTESLRNITYPVSYGATFFWMNITLFKQSLLSGNGTRYLVWFIDENETFFWWRVYLEPLLIDHKVWLGNYSIIVKHWWYSRPVNQTFAIRSVSEGEQKLVEWWSPKFLEEENETTTPEQPPEEEIKPPEKEFPWWWIIPILAIVIAVVVYMIASKRALAQAS